MGKPTGKKKNQVGYKPSDGGSAKPSKAASDRTPKALDEDTAVFISMSRELKEEGNKLFQKHDHEGAMLKYEKALKLLPRNHIDVAYLRSTMAACFMQLGLGEYPRAISECNLALEVAPKYSKALLKRARCYEALNRLRLALRDVNSVLSMEPNNMMALEIADRVKKAIKEKSDEVDEKEIVLASEFVEIPPRKVAKGMVRKKKGNKVEDKLVVEESLGVVKGEKVVVHPEENEHVVEEKEVVMKTVKLVFGEDIRWAQLPVNCSIRLLRDISLDRFPTLKGILIKYRDEEGDLVTITTTDELRLAEASGNPHGSLRFYLAEINPDQELLYDETNTDTVYQADQNSTNISGNGDVGTGIDLKEKGSGVEMQKGSACIDDWIIQFARLFKSHVGFDSDSYLDLHEIGMKLYSEAIEDTVTSEEAQELFEIAEDKFQEMAALALFNWGNVHMSKARKRVFFSEDDSRESMLAHIKTAYEWAKKEYVKAGTRYEEGLKIKPDFYEGFIALGQQQFEQAKLCWYYAIGCKDDLQAEPSSEILQLYNKAEDSMERGMQIWEEMEERRLNGLCKTVKYEAQLKKMGLNNLFRDISPDEAREQAANMKSQIYCLWGTLLYERSIVEYKLGLPVWEECLEVAVEKFELAGASRTDIAVMIKNHCSNGTASEGLGFKIAEIVQAWNEIYDAKRWQIGSPSFRLEPLFRRQASKLHSVLENF